MKDFKELNRLKKENKIVTVIFPYDGVLYEDLDEIFEKVMEINPLLIDYLVAKYGLEKAKRIIGWVTECGNYWIDGVIDADIANELAKEWNVLDVLMDDLIKLFIKKYCDIRFET